MRVLMSVTSWGAVQVQSNLMSQGYAVTAADDGIAVFESLDLLGRPVVILETDLPDLNWRVALDQLRRESPNMSILVLNSTRSEADCFKALELGADDVIDAKMDEEELAARIRAVVVRRAGYSGPNLAIGPLRLRIEERRAFWGTQKIDLTPSQFEIFQTMCLASPYSVSKHVIMAELYGLNDACEPRSIDVFVSQLRSRLVASGAPWNVIETVRGRGYRLSQFEPGEGVRPVPFEMPVEDFGIPAEFPQAA